jgi:hypothetical protein
MQANLFVSRAAGFDQQLSACDSRRHVLRVRDRLVELASARGAHHLFGDIYRFLIYRWHGGNTCRRMRA